jgi:tetratricopeptide (TPR) repeat protein
LLIAGSGYKLTIDSKERPSKLDFLKRFFGRKAKNRTDHKPSGQDDIHEILNMEMNPKDIYLLQLLFKLPPDSAIQMLKSAISRSTDLNPVEFAFGDEEDKYIFNHNDYSKADISWAEKVFKIAMAGETKAKSDKFNEAIPLLKRALRMAPGHDLLLMTLGVCYGELKQYSTAIRVLERAQQLYPTNQRIKTNLEAVRRQSET